MTAYDLNRGVIKWQVPLGNAPQGASENLKDTGIMMSRNRRVVTASGLVFIATKDEGKLRAYDEESGKVLSETDLPAASEGVPAVYEVDGREYIVLCAASAKQTAIPRDGPRSSLQTGAQGLHRIRIAEGPCGELGVTDKYETLTGLLPQFPVLRFCLLQDRNIRVRVLP